MRSEPGGYAPAAKPLNGWSSPPGISCWVRRQTPVTESVGSSSERANEALRELVRLIAGHLEQFQRADRPAVQVGQPVVALRRGQVLPAKRTTDRGVLPAGLRLQCPPVGGIGLELTHGGGRADRSLHDGLHRNPI